tara:strand:+ start:89 stop:274 length:186 start_codon:yes stop_codon:yes gene_type:complete
MDLNVQSAGRHRGLTGSSLIPREQSIFATDVTIRMAKGALERKVHYVESLRKGALWLIFAK